MKTNLVQFQSWLSDPVISKVFIVFICLVVVLLAVRSINRMLGRTISDATARYRGRKFVSFLGFLVIVVCLAVIFSDNLGRLSVAFGVAGAGVAFALQEIVVSIAGWFSIYFSNVFKVGDRIQLGGIKGDVIDISLLRTTLMEIGDWVQGDLYNGKSVRISNSFVFKDPVFNYSGEYPFVWDELVIPVLFESDFDLLKKILHDCTQEIVGDYQTEAEFYWKKLIKKFMLEDAKIAHFSAITSADASQVNFTVRYVTHYGLRRKTKDLLYNAIIQRIKATDGKVLWATSRLELSTGKDFDAEVLSGP